DADLRGMVVLRSLGFQLVPFKLHRFRKQRLSKIELKLQARENRSLELWFLFLFPKHASIPTKKLFS
ncbi:hypothetical protein QHE53_21345, partial [Aeromonas salmonicida]